MINQLLHEKIMAARPQVEAWFRDKRAGYAVPVYMSVDIRDSGAKVAVVDANLYPAGFNNICKKDQEHAPALMKKYIDVHYGVDYRKIGLLTEEHSNNPFYWENVRVLKSIIEESGREVRLAFPRALSSDLQMTSISGAVMNVTGIQVKDGRAVMNDGFEPDLLISNNDFSLNYEEFLGACKTPVNPPRELGWYQRKKSMHFKYYNQLASEFAKVIGVDEALLRVETELFDNFEVSSEESTKKLADRVDAMCASLRERYAKLGIQQEPFVFIKNNAGTYGLGVTRVSSGKDVLEWNYKTRKKMKAAKGGRDIEEVIIQEGIPTVVRGDGVTAEPAIYMIGCEIAGGFLRTHSEKGPEDSLNSPGAIYVRLCASDLQVTFEGKHLENVYGWVARLSSLAIGMEAAEMKVNFPEFQVFTCA